MKKKIGLIGLSIILIALVYQGTMAIIQETTNVNTKMSAAKVGVSIVQNDEASTEAEEEVVFEDALPGAKLSHDLKVKNAKDKELYVRVTLTKYWVNENDKKMVDAKANLINLLSSNHQDWMMIDDAANSNDEVVYYYYKKPLKANEVTPSFLKEIQCSKDLSDKLYATYKIKVDVEVDAVQSAGAKDAILSEWGMDVTFDGNNNIVSIEE